jgi:hypothetical protein
VDGGSAGVDRSAVEGSAVNEDEDFDMDSPEGADDLFYGAEEDQPWGSVDVRAATSPEETEESLRIISALEAANDDDVLAKLVNRLRIAASDDRLRFSDEADFSLVVSVDILSIYVNPRQGGDQSSWLSDQLMLALLETESKSLDGVYIPGGLSVFIDPKTPLDQRVTTLRTYIEASEQGRDVWSGYPLEDMPDDTKCIIMLYNPSGLHWVIADIVLGESPDIVLYNSMMPNTGTGLALDHARKELPLIMHLASLRPGSKLGPYWRDAVRVIPQSCTQQSDLGVDCGPLSVFNAVQRMHNQPPFPKCETAVQPDEEKRRHFGYFIRVQCAQWLNDMLDKKHNQRADVASLFDMFSAYTPPGPTSEGDRGASTRRSNGIRAKEARRLVVKLKVPKDYMAAPTSEGDRGPSTRRSTDSVTRKPDGSTRTHEESLECPYIGCDFILDVSTYRQHILDVHRKDPLPAPRRCLHLEELQKPEIRQTAWGQLEVEIRSNISKGLRALFPTEFQEDPYPCMFRLTTPPQCSYVGNSTSAKSHHMIKKHGEDLIPSEFIHRPCQACFDRYLVYPEAFSLISTASTTQPHPSTTQPYQEITRSSWLCAPCPGQVVPSIICVFRWSGPKSREFTFDDFIRLGLASVHATIKSLRDTRTEKDVVLYGRWHVPTRFTPVLEKENPSKCDKAGHASALRFSRTVFQYISTAHDASRKPLLVSHGIDGFTCNTVRMREFLTRAPPFTFAITYEYNNNPPTLANSSLVDGMYIVIYESELLLEELTTPSSTSRQYTELVAFWNQQQTGKNNHRTLKGRNIR